MTQRTCTIDSCNSPISARGWCPLHYGRWKRHGSPLADLVRPYAARDATDEDRLRHVGWDVVQRRDGLTACWEWRGNRSHGYGTVYINGRVCSAHRTAYTTWVGPIPAGDVIRHRCDNPPCLNPDHLETGTHLDNATDRLDRGREYYKLTAEQHQEIRDNFTGALGEQTLLAQEYGVSVSLIHLIVRGKIERKGGRRSDPELARGSSPSL